VVACHSLALSLLKDAVSQMTSAGQWFDSLTISSLLLHLGRSQYRLLHRLLGQTLGLDSVLGTQT